MDALYLYRYRHRCSSRGSVVIPGGLPDPIVVMYELYVVEQPPPLPALKIGDQLEHLWVQIYVEEKSAGAIEVGWGLLALPKSLQ